MSKIGILKDVVDVVVSIGVSSIVGNTIKMTTDPEAKLPKKIAITIGGVILSGLVSEAAQNYTNKKIDSYVVAATSIRDAVRNARDAVTVDINVDTEKLQETAVDVVERLAEIQLDPTTNDQKD